MLTTIAVQAVIAMAQRPQGAEGQGNWIASLMPLVVIFAIFYFLLIRPQQKQQKKHKQLLETLKRGDEVITRGGMHGKIYGITDNIVTVEVSNDVRIRFNREAIAGVSNSGTSSANNQ
jgi:preprotein translocase subunit YajC